MRPTRVQTLLGLLLIVAALVWGSLRIAESRGSALPPLGWGSPGGLLVLAVAVLVTALALRRRLRGSRPPDPLGTARMAVLGKASAYVGPLVGGLYLGYLLVLLPGLSGPDQERRALICAFAVVAAVLLSAAGLLLERFCRVDRGPDDIPPPAVTG